MATKKVKPVYFTKVAGLASIIWDPKNDCSLAEFNKQGLCRVDDPEIAKKLSAMGYQTVTSSQIKKAKLFLPEDYEAAKHAAGRGYASDDEQPNIENTGGFDPEDFPPGPDVDGEPVANEDTGGRSVVT